MAFSIGEASLKMSVNSAGFLTGIDKSARGLKNFSNLATGIFKSLASPSALFAGIGSFFGELVTEQFDIIDEISKQADVLDLSTEALTTFQYAAELAGVSNEDLAKGLNFLTRQMGGAQLSIEKSEKTLADFKDVVDFSALSVMSAEERVLTLAEAYLKIEDTSKRAAFSVAAFGKAGLAMRKFLEDIGTEGIAKFRGEADLRGRTFTRAQGAEVERAGDAIARVSLAFDGLKRQLAIGIAPLVADITEGFEKWLPSIGGVKGIAQKIAGFFFDIAEVLVNIADRIQRLVSSLPGSRPTSFLPEAQVAIVEMFDAGKIKEAEALAAQLGSTIANMRKEIEKRATGGTLFDVAREAIDRARKNMTDVGETQEGPLTRIGRALQGLRDRAKVANQGIADDADKLNEKLRQQIETYGESGLAAELWALKQRAAKTGFQSLGLAMAEALIKQVEAMDRYKKLSAEAVSVIEAGKTPAEEFAAKGDRLNEMLAAGVLTWAQYERAVRAAGAALDSTGGKMELPGALERGTSAAVSAVMRFRAGETGAQNPNAKVEELLREGKVIQAAQARLLADIKRLLGGSGIVGNLIPGG